MSSSVIFSQSSMVSTDQAATTLDNNLVSIAAPAGRVHITGFHWFTIDVKVEPSALWFNRGTGSEPEKQ